MILILYTLLSMKILLYADHNVAYEIDEIDELFSL